MSNRVMKSIKSAAIFKIISFLIVFIYSFVIKFSFLCKQEYFSDKKFDFFINLDELKIYFELFISSNKVERNIYIIQMNEADYFLLKIEYPKKKLEDS